MTRRAGPALLSVAVAACASFAAGAAARPSAPGLRANVGGAQGQRRAPRRARRPARAEAGAGQAPERVEGARLSEAGERLVRDSKAAVLAQGISGPYFDAHFRVFKVVDAPGDRRVVWSFRVNGHEALVSDTVGYYTDARGRLVDTHSIAGALPAAHDITRTISRRRAERIMRACIGRFEGGAVVYRAAGAPERAALIFTAASAPRRGRREGEEGARAAGAKEEKRPPRTDVIEGGDEEGGGAPVYIGAVDLETGRCTKGRGIADHHAPERRPRR